MGRKREGSAQRTAGFQLKRFENQLCFISLDGPMSRGEGGAEPRYGELVGESSSFCTIFGERSSGAAIDVVSWVIRGFGTRLTLRLPLTLRRAADFAYFLSGDLRRMAVRADDVLPSRGVAEVRPPLRRFWPD